ncbi:MAG: bifunctional DNA-formamidopyrimidine glycosylase/DNA-(apurinic or apyrimidinic site) lyase [Patescibacteria group bacterium]|nr:bifunctional DNA-formamidopyrimidine glycosylase/DNA-(apurinic or apyrimidinic site) lyase [Patescibacteria group bacterium]
MPELPEVQTTVNGLRQRIIGLTISDAWSDYDSQFFKGSETIKDPRYFKHFKLEIIGRTVTSVDRRAKNILIRLSGGLTILVHMKMTGHLLFGTYRFAGARTKDPWIPVEPASLKDPFNRHVHFVLTFNTGKNLALSDVRRFAKVTAVNTDIIDESVHLHSIGPEPLENDFTFKRFEARLDLRSDGKIKLVLLDQKILAGVGNIYSDESLWRAGINPLERVKNIPLAKRKLLFAAIRKTLARGIDLGGDSTSDYRNVDGQKGLFHEKHSAYQQTGIKCAKPGCPGTIRRIVVGGRGTHYCDAHQKLSEKS